MSLAIKQQSGSPEITVNQNNVVVLEIDNLLSNWPTYVINYTPEQPGPLKIILRLKDVRKCAIEDGDETSDSEDEKNVSAVVKHWRVEGASITLQLDSSCEDLENSKDEPDRSDDSDDKTLVVDAIPVAFDGILKDKIPVKPKFFDSDETLWPPVRPRFPRPISSNEPLCQFNFLKTFPAPVKIIDDKLDH